MIWFSYLIYRRSQTRVGYEKRFTVQIEKATKARSFACSIFFNQYPSLSIPFSFQKKKKRGSNSLPFCQFVSLFFSVLCTSKDTTQSVPILLDRPCTSTFAQGKGYKEKRRVSGDEGCWEWDVSVTASSLSQFVY